MIEAMPSFESSRLIAAPPDAVFALVSDAARLRALDHEPEGAAMRREVRVEHVAGPAAGSGATYEVSERLAGRDMGTHVLVTGDFEPGRRVAYTTRDGHDTIYELEPAEGGTLLTVRRVYADDAGGPVRRAATKHALVAETVAPEIDKELGRIDYALRGSPGAEPTEDGGFRVSLVLERPPSAVFAYVSDGRHRAELLDPTGERAQVEHLEGPLVGAGARYRLTRRDRDEPAESYEFSTVEFEPGRRVAYEFPGYAIDVFDVSPGAGGTRLALERKPVRNRRGVRARLFARHAFTADRVVPQIEADLQAIRRALASAG